MGQQILRRIASPALLALALLAGAAPAFGAGEPPVCGTTLPGAAQPVQATLALADADAETVTAALYGRHTGDRQLTLVYTASGCRLTGTLPAPRDPPFVGPPKDDKVGTIPNGAIRLNGPPEVDGNHYIVRLQVSSRRFDPGTYAGFLDLNASWMHRTGTPVAISRSENRWLLVLGVALLGAFGGFVVFMLLHAFSRANLLASGSRVAIAAVLSVGLGSYVAYTTNYLNQDVWTLGANTLALLTAAFTAATSGHLITGLLGKVYDDTAKVNPQPDGPGLASRVAGRLRKRPPEVGTADA
jgi:hypothetical protein